MELLHGAGRDDVVSELLRSVRVRSTIWCRSELRAPWGFGTDASGTAAFHVVTAGRCWLQVEGGGVQRELAAGDLIVLPTGRRHWLRDDPATPAPGLDRLLASHPLDGQGRLRGGGRGPRTTLLCGGFVLESGETQPLLEALPPVIHVRGVRGRPLPWVAATLALLSTEVGGGAPGAEAVVGRLADALLTQALRVAVAGPDAGDGVPTPGALRDPQIAAAVRLIHGQPQRPWTVGELAAEVALSRSAFAARFHELVGEPPMRYLIRARLGHAAGLLHTTNASLAEIARRTGYESEYSFGRAFKRVFGVPPGAYRGRARAGHGNYSVQSSELQTTTRY
jgi:AraC family transcriptional regulator, alkane utilization regulator